MKKIFGQLSKWFIGFLQSIFSPNTTSEQFRVNLRDFFKGAIVAALTAPATILYTSLEAKQFSYDWHAIKMAAITGFLAYLIKNYLTPSNQ